VDGVVAAEGVSLACEASFFKKGFLVSESVGGLVTGKLVWSTGVGTGGTKVGIGGGGGEISWLPKVGVEA
jgi:hypothetical protein